MRQPPDRQAEANPGSRFVHQGAAQWMAAPRIRRSRQGSCRGQALGLILIGFLMAGAGCEFRDRAQEQRDAEAAKQAQAELTKERDARQRLEADLARERDARQKAEEELSREREARQRAEAQVSARLASTAAPQRAEGRRAAESAVTPGPDAELHLNQGMTYAKMRDYDNAILEFSKALELNRRYAAAYVNRAVAYMQQRKYNKALDDLKQAERLNPRDKMVFYNYTALYSLQNQLDRALDALDRSLDLGFNNYDALRGDPDLNNVRTHPEFAKVLEKHKVFIR